MWKSLGIAFGIIVGIGLGFGVLVVGCVGCLGGLAAAGEASENAQVLRIHKGIGEVKQMDGYGWLEVEPPYAYVGWTEWPENAQQVTQDAAQRATDELGRPVTVYSVSLAGPGWRPVDGGEFVSATGAVAER